ncbi:MULTISPECIES: sensor histidine kinase [Micromonospora]|uniref:Sensor-like histidine kinase SenX3 n=1 Tax=Micromonospora yangpuensis TaxID=683228 RepID=A0A1C6VC80_9ACTN|nr:ATP-binding protein [Micromonospora yangpuensis]GGM12917.1 two-component sensor histidine kinase [Micromonospora yangpuensis]SCL63952.1 two-component system, OmpR family, sensor histidine kinase SenX3 [Micromonospora yangpuensis]
MEWAVPVAVAVGLTVGLVAGLLLPRVRSTRRGRAASGATVRSGRDSIFGRGRPTIADDHQVEVSGLGRRTIDSLRAGVVVLGPDDVPVLVNPAARAMGLLRAGARPGTMAAHPLIRTLAGQVRRTGVRREIELDLPRGRATAGPDPLGVHLRAMGIGGGFVAVEAADVTESHRLARVRRDFVANVSHELKTPIGALQLLAEALLDATEPAGADVPDLSEDLVAARRFAERIQHESTRLGRLVQELLELTRLQGAEPQPPPEPVTVEWVFAEVLDRTRTSAAARRVDVQVEAEPGLTVHGSDTQLATAVANLVENAINYSAEETVVRVVACAADDDIRIAVTDQGIGIAPNDVDRIFERFYRADQARSRSTGGTGLGLAIVKHIASNHGGRVEVSSTLGGGSTFTLRLPARPPEDLAATLSSAGIEPGPAELRQA